MNEARSEMAGRDGRSISSVKMAGWTLGNGQWELNGNIGGVVRGAPPKFLVNLPSYFWGGQERGGPVMEPLIGLVLTQAWKTCQPLHWNTLELQRQASVAATSCTYEYFQVYSWRVPSGTGTPVLALT